MREDGLLEFRGRIDDQVKVRGFRVELEEVEAALRAASGVRQAAAAVVGESASARRLVAWVVPEAEQLDEQAVRAAVAAGLPPHMVPAKVHHVDALPLTPSGKLDRTRLHDRAGAAPAPKPASEALEDRIAAVFARLVQVEDVHVDDSFFDLGGTSLQAVELVGLLRDLGLPAKLKHIASFGTPAGLARELG